MNFFNVNNIINKNKKSSFQIKKSVGASNYQLLTESFFIATLQAVCVLTLAFIFLSILMQASENVREFILTQETGRLISSFSVAFFSLYIAILISHYLYLSTSVFPNKSWHNHAYSAHPISHYIYQVTLSIQIAIAGIIIYLWAGIMTQIDFMQSHSFGYEKENVVTFTLSDELKSLISLNSLQDELNNSIGTSPIALSSWRPFDMSRTTTSVFHQNQQEQDKLVSVNMLNVNKNFIDTWGIKTLAGYENPITPSKNDNTYHAIATKTFMSAMGKSSSDEVLNTLFYINDNDAEYTVRILRVVNDFYLADRDKNTTPLLILISDEVQRYGALKLPHRNVLSTVEMLLERYGVNINQIKLAEHIHQEYFNNHNLMKKTISLVTLFSVALLLISTMIIGIAESKRISKILKIMESVGGSLYTHVIFFIQQNVTPVLVAVAIAFPIGFILLQKWLSKYNFINNLSYLYAFGTLLLFMVSIVSVMTLSLILSHTKKNK
ncbi:hypothetical protein B7R74_16125 [Yersinia pseudotuberculosis]|nr:hypothetical protein B7R74_16125 [Yersinia pseudotuberculosis]